MDEEALKLGLGVYVGVIVRDCFVSCAYDASVFPWVGNVRFASRSVQRGTEIETYTFEVNSYDQV